MSTQLTYLVTESSSPTDQNDGFDVIMSLDPQLSLISFAHLLWVVINARNGLQRLAHLRGATTAEKLRGTKVWVPTPGRWVREGVVPSRCDGPGYYPRKILENSDAKSCIMVTTCCEIPCILKTTAKKLGDQ